MIAAAVIVTGTAAAAVASCIKTEEVGIISKSGAVMSDNSSSTPGVHTVPADRLISDLDKYYTELRRERFLAMLSELKISEKEFDEIYARDFAGMNFVEMVEILTMLLNGSIPFILLNSKIRRYAFSAEKAGMLICAYIKKGGDPEYFISGSGSPGAWGPHPTFRLLPFLPPLRTWFRR